MSFNKEFSSVQRKTRQGLSAINLSLTVMVVAFVLAFGLVATSPVQASVELEDIDNHWAKERIDEWASKELVHGYPDGTFKPDAEIKRAEFITFLNRAFELVDDETELAGVEFDDVTAEDWYYEEVAAGVKAEVLSGYPDGTFGPEEPVLRQEAASIIYRLLTLDGSDGKDELPFEDRDDFDSWIVSPVNAVHEAGVLSGYPDGNFHPHQAITRGEAIAALDKALEYQHQDEDKPQGIGIPYPDGLEGIIEEFILTFAVQDQEGNVVEDAQVEIYEDEELDREVDVLETEPGGEAITLLPTGSYYFKVTHQDHEDYEGEFTVYGFDKTIWIELEKVEDNDNDDDDDDENDDDE